MDEAPAHDLGPEWSEEVELGADVGPGPLKRTWRYQLLIRAIGSETPDGSDLTASDRHILTRIDRYLATFAIANGDEAAGQALLSVLDVLEEGDAELANACRH
jgi:hypothetical protein